jgi:hypothetical protein
MSTAIIRPSVGLFLSDFVPIDQAEAIEAATKRS